MPPPPEAAHRDHPRRTALPVAAASPSSKVLKPSSLVDALARSSSASRISSMASMCCLTEDMQVGSEWPSVWAKASLGKRKCEDAVSRYVFSAVMWVRISTHVCMCSKSKLHDQFILQMCARSTAVDICSKLCSQADDLVQKIERHFEKAEKNIRNIPYNDKWIVGKKPKVLSHWLFLSSRKFAWVIGFHHNSNSLLAMDACARDPTADPSSPYFVDANHPYTVAAASTLTSHRAKSKWSHLSSVPAPSPLPASAAAAVFLLLRRRPHTAIRFHAFALRRLLPARSPPPLVFSASAAHIAAASRLRGAALDVLTSATRHHSPIEIFNALAATYRRFASAPFVFDLLLLAYLRSRRDALAAASVARRILATGGRPLPSTAAALLRSLPSAAALDMYHQIYTRSGQKTNRMLLPTIHTFNSLLLACYREGKYDGFNTVLKEMDKYSCKHNVCTYNIRMAGCCDRGEVETARGLWDEMIEERIQPDVTAFNTMIGGYCRARKVGTAEEMFKDMEIGGIHPSATTFEWLVRGHCMAEEVDAAMLVRSDMRRRGFGMAAEVVEELLDGLCQKRRVEDALRILREEMRREEFEPTRRSYEMLIRGFSGEGEMEMAIRLQAEMAGKGFKAGAEVYYAFIRGYEKSEDYDMVDKLKKEMALMSTDYASTTGG